MRGKTKKIKNKNRPDWALSVLDGVVSSVFISCLVLDSSVMGM